MGIRLGFADESGTNEESGCYGIGVLSFPEDRRTAFSTLFSELSRAHKLDTEQKWEKITTTYSRMNFLLDWLDRILKSQVASFDIIIVNKKLFRLWNEVGCDRETAFYKTYTQILTHAARRTGDKIRVSIDDRSDRYDKQVDVIQIVGNHMLKDLAESERLTDVSKVDSKSEPAIQIADLLTGAITSAHRVSLDPGFHPHPGKLLVLKRMAEILGWDDLVCDTLPDSRFNIWHFPIEYRAVPETRRIGDVKPPRHIEKSDIDRLPRAG